MLQTAANEAEHAQDVLGSGAVRVNTTSLDSDLDDEDVMLDASVLHPRSKPTFYGVACAGLRLWQRPPEDHCNRCAQYNVKWARVQVLMAALYSAPGAVENVENVKVVKRAGGQVGPQRRRGSCRSSCQTCVITLHGESGSECTCCSANVRYWRSC